LRTIELLRREDFCSKGEEIFIPAGLIRERAAHCPGFIDGVSGIHFVGVAIVGEGAQLESEIGVSEYPIGRGALIEPYKNEVAFAVRTTDLFMSRPKAEESLFQKDPSLRSG